MKFCIKENEIDELKHIIVSGPYDSAGQCADGCGQTGSENIIILRTEALTDARSPGMVFFNVVMKSQDGRPIFFYAEGNWNHTVETSTTYRVPLTGFESVASEHPLGGNVRLENLESGSTATFNLYVSQEADLSTFSFLISLSATIP